MPTSPPTPRTDEDLARWDYALPEDRIARYPESRRSASRLMHLPRQGAAPSDHRFHELEQLLRPGDLLVGNDTRVLPARLRAHRKTGGQVELLILGPGDPEGVVPALVRPLRRLGEGEVLELLGGGTVELGPRLEDGQVLVRFHGDPVEVMEAQGEMPLPPYLGRAANAQDRERYQTVYAGPPGAAAAPTAGLHFDEPLLERLAARGIAFHTVTLHVGIGTFRPLRPEDVARGALHAEPWSVPEDTAQAIASTRASGGRVVAVGTTTVRTLESATPEGHRVPTPGSGTTRLFLRPPYTFRCVDGLITNFHLPRSSLLMLVAAFVGRERLLAAYDQAVGRGYRFYSYGDAMLVL